MRCDTLTPNEYRQRYPFIDQPLARPDGRLSSRVHQVCVFVGTHTAGAVDKKWLRVQRLSAAHYAHFCSSDQVSREHDLITDLSRGKRTFAVIT